MEARAVVIVTGRIQGHSFPSCGASVDVGGGDRQCNRAAVARVQQGAFHGRASTATAAHAGLELNRTCDNDNAQLTVTSDPSGTSPGYAHCGSVAVNAICHFWSCHFSSSHFWSCHFWMLLMLSRGNQQTSQLGLACLLLQFWRTRAVSPTMRTRSFFFPVSEPTSGNSKLVTLGATAV